MDALSDILAPYSDVIAKVAGTITCMQFLSGIFIMYDIKKQQSSDKFPVEPFLGGVVLSVLGLKLGTVMSDEATIKVNVIGLGINAVFMAIFYYYASSNGRTGIWSKIGKATLFSMACLAYTNFEDPAKLEARLGMLITGILVVLVGSPLLQLNKIIEKKSTEGLPFPLILSGTAVAFSWLLYGFSIRNDVVIYQNLLLFALSAIQLSLFVIYPNTNGGTPKASPEKQANDKKQN